MQCINTEENYKTDFKSLISHNISKYCLVQAIMNSKAMDMVFAIRQVSISEEDSNYATIPSQWF